MGIANAAQALTNGTAWGSVKETFNKAAQGDQKALEEVSAIFISALIPAKKIPLPNKSGNKAKGIATQKPNAGKGTTELSSQIKDVKSISAADTNAPFIQKGWNPPYDSSTQVKQFTTTKSSQGEFVRVYAEGMNKPSGAFIVRMDEIKDMTPQQIKHHLALPNVPTHVTDVNIPAGTRMQTGKVAAQPEFGVYKNGGTQYELIDRIPENSFKNIRLLQ